MSKPVKEMILAEYQKRFADLDGALLIDIRGIDANENNTIRLDLATKGIQVTVVKNSLARKALAGTSLDAFQPVLDGPSALVYGADSPVHVARALVEWAKKVEALDLKAAILSGELFEGARGVKLLSEYPTREEAQATAVQIVLVPGSEIVSAVTAPGGEVLSIVEAIIGKLEKGEEITATAVT